MRDCTRLLVVVATVVGCTVKSEGDDDIAAPETDTQTDTDTDTDTDTSEDPECPTYEGPAGWSNVVGHVGATRLVWTDAGRMIAHDDYVLILFDGQQWREVAPGGILAQVWARDIDDVWLATLDSTVPFNGQGTPGGLWLWHWNGEDFTLVLEPSPAAEKGLYSRNGFSGVTGSPDGTRIWAMEVATPVEGEGPSITWTLEAGTWVEQPEPFNVPLNQARMSYFEGTAWVYSEAHSDGDSGGLLRWANQTWEPAGYNTGELWVDGLKIWSFAGGFLDNGATVSAFDGHGSPYTESFVGGDVLQSFLSGSDYHRWHAPISGTVREVRVIPGLMFSELLSEGFDISAGTESQGYETMVNTRGLVVIENKSIGKVAVLPVGITEISSVTMTVDVGQVVEKGQELGYFSYGGSTLALVFQRGMIEQFTAKVPDPHVPPPHADCKTVKNCRACDGCLRVRGKVADAN